MLDEYSEINLSSEVSDTSDVNLDAGMDTYDAADTAMDSALDEQEFDESTSEENIIDDASDTQLNEQTYEFDDANADSYMEDSWDEEDYESADLSEDEDSPKVLRRDPTEMWITGNSAIEDNLEAMRDDLRDKGWPDGPEMEAMVMAEKPKLLDEFRRNMDGDFSNPYLGADFPVYPGNQESSDAAVPSSSADVPITPIEGTSSGEGDLFDTPDIEFSDTSDSWNDADSDQESDEYTEEDFHDDSTPEVQQNNDLETASSDDFMNLSEAEYQEESMLQTEMSDSAKPDSTDATDDSASEELSDIDDSVEPFADLNRVDNLDAMLDDTSMEDSDQMQNNDSQDYTVEDIMSNDTQTNDVAQDANDIHDVSEWLGDINPNFDEFDPESPYCNNCGSCAFAVYQRLEGLSPDACASADNIGYNDEMNALTGMEQVSMSPSEIEQRLLAQGDGAHAIIGIDRAEGAGHWFNAACIDGRVVAIDGQSGEITEWPPDYGDVVNWEMSVKS